MDALTLFGLFAVTAMLVSYALEDRSHWFVLLFAASNCAGTRSFPQIARPALFGWRSKCPFRSLKYRSIAVFTSSRPTAFSRAPGRSVWSKRSGPSWRCGGGS